MLIKAHRLEIETADHSSEIFEYEAIAYLEADITVVFPYLNATLKSGQYLPDVPAFSWRKGPHKISFWKDRIAADHLETREQAQQVIGELIDLVNGTWEKRDFITPDHRVHEPRQPLEIFRLTPKTNCKLCGEASCYNFALQLAAGRKELVACIPLYKEDQYESNRTELETIMEEKRPLL
jgi:ArsR family metal-binding transcriptional regulator